MLHTHHHRRSRLQLASITVLLYAFSSTLVLTNSFSIFPSPPKTTPSTPSPSPTRTPTTPTNKNNNDKKCTIKICHNKDCTKHGGGEALLDTFRDLLPASSSSSEDNSSGNTIVSIESSGCLSQCGKGPNISVVSPVVENGNNNNGENMNEKMYFGVEDVTTASAVLDVVTGEEYPIHLLVAAASIAEAEHATSPSKKETLLTSAISAITKDDDPALVNSFAHAHALYLRADARLDLLASSSSTTQTTITTTTTPNNNILYGAVNDAKKSTRIHPTEGRAWQTLSRVQEANGNIQEAMDAVEEWARLNPSFGTKAKREMERLVGLL